MALDIEWKENVEFGEFFKKRGSDFKCNHASVSIEGKPVLWADKYNYYASAYWKADRTKEEDIVSIINFYQELEKGNFQAMKEEDKMFGLGVMIRSEKGHVNLPKEDLTNFEKIVSQPLYVCTEYYLIRFNTEYADIGLACLKRKSGPGIPEIGVITHQSLGEPMAKFILETGGIKVDMKELLPIIQEIYTFDRK